MAGQGVTTGRAVALTVVTVCALLLSACAPSSPPAAGFVQPASCPTGTGVASADQLSAALEVAAPGETIVLADGTYSGRFTISRSGTSDAPITVCGGPGAVLDGGATDHGYTLHLDGASFWVLDGFTGTTAADSLIDVKGSGWLVSGNTGTSAPIDGAQVHVILPGWGASNTFSANSFSVASDGYAVLLEGAARNAANVVACDNIATVGGAPMPAFITNGSCRATG